jgi:ABC-2 type transport system permease protein
MIADTWYLFHKYMKITIRMPMWTFFTLVQPLIWLIIFGQLFSNIAHLPGFPTVSYTDFFVPGVLIMTVLFGSSWSGVSLLREIQSGTVDKMLVSPVSRVSVVLSRVLHSTAQVVVQVIIMLIVAWLMGAHLNLNPAYLGLSMLIVLLLGLCFAAVSNGFAIALQREEPLVIIGNLMTLPLMFFSTALVPDSFMPAWIKYIATINPINYAVEAVRDVLIGHPNLSAYGTETLILSLFTAAAIWWAVASFDALRD